ncbi:hypothetical protein RFI_35879 [Reticulomyxa filosa]|uniref:Uncharacterized protein n=1 Tax=Reticulomyxa filosa TaxID=46433 RepID=X6LJL6_RETFI|nr:hypothetical protein RFI_35879 [Reticulomyxa filosa]|eukprot:ETO01561.1 hypothetical protein RFI_35879 [Reticulomyxa filosa]
MIEKLQVNDRTEMKVLDKLLAQGHDDKGYFVKYDIYLNVGNYILLEEGGTSVVKYIGMEWSWTRVTPMPMMEHSMDRPYFKPKWEGPMLQVLSFKSETESLFKEEEEEEEEEGDHILLHLSEQELLKHLKIDDHVLLIREDELASQWTQW